jgi:hypothetical protein
MTPVTIEEAVRLGKSVAPVVQWLEGRAHSDTGAASAAVELPVGSRVLEVRASEDTFILFGTALVEAAPDETSDLFLRGVQVLLVPEGATHCAVIQSTTAGVIQFRRVG